jgi:tRNA(Ile)-lysidine synthase TilS/MesJ
MIQSEDVVVYKLGKDFRNVVLRDILQMFAEKAPIELIKLPTKKKIDKIAVSSTIDSEANEIVQYIIKKNIKKLDAKPVDNKIVKPLYLFLDEEVLIYAKIKKLKFTPTKIKKDNISEFIDVLEMKHPEIKRAIVNSYLKI